MDDHKSRVQAQFGAAASAYVTSTVHAQGEDLKRMVALADLKGHEKVLDIATGAGHTALAFAPHVGSVIASDITAEMLRVAEAHLTRAGVSNVTYQIADAEALPFPDASFDIVTCRTAPHHFSQPQSFVQGVARILRPGGLFIMSDTVGHEDPIYNDFINTVEVRRDPSHYFSYTLSQWLEWLTAVGLRVVHVETSAIELDFDDWTERMNMAATDKAALAQFMIAAAEPLRQHYRINIDQERVISFTLDKALLVAVKDAEVDGDS